MHAEVEWVGRKNERSMQKFYGNYSIWVYLSGKKKKGKLEKEEDKICFFFF
jgi:hypothetical protein